MHKSLSLSLATLALAFTAAQAGGGWQLTNSALGSNKNPPTTPQPNSPGGSGYVCAKGGLGGAVTTSVVNGYMTISYTGVIIGNPSTVQAELTSYKNCVTTAPATFNVACHRMSAHATSAVCYVRFSTTPVKWGGTPGASGTPGWISSCEANLGSPTITIPAKLAAATISYAPAKMWLLNLPVEWTYKNLPAPSSISTTITSGSSNTCYGPTYSGTYHPQKGETVTKYLSLSVTIANHVSSTHYLSRSGVAGNIYPDSPLEQRAGYNSSRSLQTVYCDSPHPLLNPNTLPDYTVLSQYSQLFSRNSVCNFDPDTQRILNWVAAIHEVAPTSKTGSTVQFVLSQQYQYAVNYSATGSETSNCFTDTTYASGRVVDQSCSTNSSFTFPTHSETVEASAVLAKSAPVAIDFVTARATPCFTVSCTKG